MWLAIKGINFQDLSSAMSEVKLITSSLYQQVFPAHHFLNIQTNRFHFVTLEAKKSVHFGILFFYGSCWSRSIYFSLKGFITTATKCLVQPKNPPLVFTRLPVQTTAVLSQLSRLKRMFPLHDSLLSPRNIAPSLCRGNPTLSLL